LREAAVAVQKVAVVVVEGIELPPALAEVGHLPNLL
jgi:hypothetical protein